MPNQLYAWHFILRLVTICGCILVSASLAYVSFLLDADAQYLVFVPAVVLSCWLYEGFGATISIVLSALALWDWFIPPDGFAVPNAEDTRHLLAFMVVAAFVSWIIVRNRRSYDDLARDNF